MSKQARVVVASTRAATGVYPDRTGPLITTWLAERGYEPGEPVVVADGEPVAQALRTALGEQVAVVITTGGTGLTPTDHTPEVTRPLLDYEVPGLADAIRAAGLPQVPTAVLSRGLAGVAGRTLVVNLPGSTGGVKDGLAVLDGVLDHAVQQLHGGDHVPAPQAAGEPAVVVRAEVTESPISVDEHAELVSHRAAGAVVSFAGVVRDHDHGRSVDELEYSGHPTAGSIIAEVAASVAARHPGVRAVAVSHRIGQLAIGDAALACAVSAAHRKEAFLACADLVDEVKLRLPVWKRQQFSDGSEEWVNLP
ncbi:molybdenum cofactor biosynthesis protein MoaE [Kutzneria viridogrisea]|uniref:Molybdenum cofactor biosynthesis protein B n=2 Tax=Kutzneria TaxID=43356 RepID=W5VZC0_9PSEU|nr:molybdenum cofactor biosynthesis protein MoaE [Kutzneria albida]AHH93927.1 molybdenum cofactor biosynthesis protein B [Kutzneria albida DSM 43870]MBA8931068.1 molybdenum cofactor synthesis domain-containing protein [Kutzneria viridogrisea]